MPTRELTPPRSTPATGVLPMGRASMRAAGIAAGITFVYTLAYWIIQHSQISDSASAILGEAAFIPLNLAVASLFWMAACRGDYAAPVRRALRLFAISNLSVLTGNAISLAYTFRNPTPPVVSAADIFYLADYVVTLTALLSFPLARRSRGELRKYFLDSGMMLCGAGVAIWYLFLRPAEQHPSSEMRMATAYALASVLLIVGIATMLLRRPGGAPRAALRLMVAGVTISVVGDLTFTLAEMGLGYRASGASDLVYLLTYIVLITSGTLFWRSAAPPPEPSTDTDDVQPLTPFPFLAAAGVYGLLAVGALSHWVTPLSELALGVMTVTLLLCIRLYLAVRENVSLLTERAARASETRFRSLVQHSSDVIMVLDAGGVVRFVSPSASGVFGYDPELLVGRRLVDLLHPEDADMASAFLTTTAQLPGPTPPVGWRIRHPDGSWLAAEAVGTNLLSDPVIGGIVVNVRDVTERKQLEDLLAHQAFHDPLTGLANRALFFDRASHALALAARRRHSVTAVYLDLDDFKRINDSLGHAEGDRLLVTVAERLRSCARVTDTVARLGGDEFAILLEDVSGALDVQPLLERIEEMMREPVVLGTREVVVSASVGVASGAGVDALTLMRNADVAMYAAKRGGKGRSRTFEPGLEGAVADRLALEGDLRRAVDRAEMRLHYQPIIAMDSGRLWAVEALARWAHPERGLLHPGDFIAIAEETGLIVSLGAELLRQACRAGAEWARLAPAESLGVTVNISGRQLQADGFPAIVHGALDESGIPPELLVLEITESTLMHLTAEMTETLTHIRSMGVRLAVDDFGTGYSSLNYLRRFPVEILKIAKPFVDDLSRENGSTLARAILAFAETMQLDAIAEGIETSHQRARLADIGCLLGQGFLFSEPVPAEQITAMLGGAKPAYTPNRGVAVVAR